MQRFDRTQFSRKGKKSAGKRGLTLLFVGDGKGKTTAAIGTAVRAKGAGLRVCVVQFMKTPKWQSYERASLKKLGIPVRVLGSGFVGILDDTHTLAWHKRQARKAQAQTIKLLNNGAYNLIIADEAVSAVDERLLGVRDVLRLIKAKPATTHLILTGHSRYPTLEKACDLVTVMTNIKHPYSTQGIQAQQGIDF